MQVVSQTSVGNFEVAVYEIAGLKVETLKSKNAPEGAEFLPSKVVNAKGETLWKFDKNRYLGAYAWLREVDDDDLIIAYATRSAVYEVIPVKDLPSMRLVKDDSGRMSYEGGRNSQAIVELKLIIAEDLGLEPIFSTSEALIAKLLRRRKAEARAEAEAEQKAQAQAAREARVREQQLRITRILERKPLIGFTADGQRLTGIPVVGDEYQSLPHGKWVMLVESYDESTGKAGDIIEHFVVSKTGSGRVSKAQVRVVTATNPKQVQVTATKRGEQVVEIDNVFHTVSLYDQAGISALHAAGLNSATKVGLWPTNKDGTITIFEVVKKGPREIGRYKPLV